MATLDDVFRRFALDKVEPGFGAPSDADSDDDDSMNEDELDELDRNKPPPKRHKSSHDAQVTEVDRVRVFPCFVTLAHRFQANFRPSLTG